MGALSKSSVPLDPQQIEVITPNFSRRLSGVTSTLERLFPVQARALTIAAIGPGLSPSIPRIGWLDLLRLREPPPTRPFRIWHARRNLEMLAGIVLRDVLRLPLRLVFTSASQRVHTRWTKRLIARMDAVIATSKASASYLDRPSTIIAHGMDTDLFHPAHDKTRARAELGLPPLHFVGCFGRIREQKGTGDFVEAMIDILPSRPDCGALVLGRATSAHKDYAATLKAKVEAAGLSDRILFPDEVPPSQIAAWYRALDIYVAPQRWEGFGVTPLEAMASNIPVVATRVGAFEDLLAEDSGVLIDAGDVSAMARETALLLDNPQAAAALAEAGYSRVKEYFSIQREAHLIGQVYEHLWTMDKAQHG